MVRGRARPGFGARRLGPALALLLAAVSAGAQPERVNVPELGRLPAFSHAALTDDLVFVSGMIATKSGTTEVIDAGVGPQTTAALEHMETILRAQGATRHDVAKCTVFLADMADYAAMNEAWIAFFGQPAPARSTVAVAGLALGARLEVECIAARPDRVAASAPPDTPVATGFVESGGERIHFESAGTGEAVVLTHGYGGNHASWFQQVPDLARDHRVVAWDQRGFGRSTRSTGRLGPVAAADDLGALLDHLGIERAHLVGQSMGGWSVLGFALRHPERVRKLVLAASVAGIGTPAIDAHFERLLAQAPPPSDPFPLAHHPALHPGLARRDPARALLYREIGHAHGPPPPELPQLLRDTRWPEDALAELDVPVLFVVGSEDRLFPPALVREAAARLPRSEVIEIPGAGHSPYFERPAAWNAAVRDFLTRE